MEFSLNGFIKGFKAGLPLADAAARHGFTDQSHMTRQFKRWIGVTPGEYYQANRS